MREYVFQGRIWVLTTSDKTLIPDIDTDQIFHNAHLHITDINEMGKFALGNLTGWKDFSIKTKPGDMILAGQNFGSGSSRQQAVDCFKSLGIKLIIAESFGAIYKRNAINSGFPILNFPEAQKFINSHEIDNLNLVKVDLLSGLMTNMNSGKKYELSPFSKVQKDIFEKGSLLKL